METNRNRPPIEIFADPITKVYSDITDQLLVNIARRFNVTDKTVGSTEWQFQQLAKMGQLTKENLTIIATMTGQNVELMQEALERSAMAALDTIEPQFAEAVKKGFLHDAPMSEGVKSVLTAYQSQAIDKLNLVNTTMLQSSQAAFKKAVSSTGIYTQQFLSEEQAKVAQQALNTATGSVATGAESRTAAVRRALKEMSDAGITGFVDKAGKKWSADAYVNMDVRTTCGNVATEAAFARNADYGNDLIWWPILATARPGCYPYQGKVCSTTGRSGTVDDLDGNQISFIALSSTTYGEPAGIGGINCHHKPPNIFIPGLSKVRGEVPPKEANDKRYEKGQDIKRAEREARYARRDAKIAEATKDTELAKKTTAKADALESRLPKTPRTTVKPRTLVDMIEGDDSGESSLYIRKLEHGKAKSFGMPSTSPSRPRAPKTISRAELDSKARKVYIEMNKGEIGEHVAELRYEALAMNNSNAQLRDYIKRHGKQYGVTLPKNAKIAPKATTGKKTVTKSATIPSKAKQMVEPIARPNEKPIANTIPKQTKKALPKQAPKTISPTTLVDSGESSLYIRKMEYAVFKPIPKPSYKPVAPKATPAKKSGKIIRTRAELEVEAKKAYIAKNAPLIGVDEAARRADLLAYGSTAAQTRDFINKYGSKKVRLAKGVK